MALGSLVVEVAANVARFQSDMGKMAQIAEDRMKQIDRALGVVSTAMKSLGAAAAVGLTFETIKGKIDAAIESTAGLQQLAERTGASVEGLSALAATAKLSNTDAEALATGLQKLSKSMVDASDGGKKTGAAFDAIGISTKDLKNLKPDEAFLLISNRLAGYADGAGKTALAQALLGKSGANLLPVMKDLADVGAFQVRVTTEQARLSDEYEKNLKRLDAANTAIAKTIGLELVPVLNEFTKALLENLTGANGLKGAVDGMAEDKTIRNWAEGAATAVAVVIESFQGLAKTVYAIGGSFQSVFADLTFLGTAAERLSPAAGGAFNLVFKKNRDDLAKLLDERNKMAAQANQRYVDLWNYDSRALEKSVKQRFELLNASGANYGHEGRNSALPKVPFKSNTCACDAAVTYAAALKEQERIIQQEKALYTQRDAFLSQSYADDLVSIRAYFAARQTASEDELVAIVAAYDKELAAAQKYLKGAKDANEAIKAREQITDILAKRQEAVNSQGAKASLISHQEQQATQAYSDSIGHLNVQLLQLQGDLVGAARAQAELADRQLKARLAIENDAGAEKLLADLRKQEDLRTQINALDQKAALIAQQQATAEGRANLLVTTGAQGEIAAMLQIGDARKRSVDQLEAIVVEMKRVADTTGNPKLIADAEAFRLKIDELKASADVLGKTFDDIFQNSFTTAFEGFIKGTLSASKAFQSFAGSVVQEIDKIIAKEIASKLFGGTGGLLSGLGSIAASVFGGTPSLGGGAVPGVSGGRAGGGPVTAGHIYEVNERGMPEIASFGGRDYLLAGKNGNVTPLKQASAGHITINQHFAPGTDRRTINQAATDVGAVITRATRRNA